MIACILVTLTFTGIALIAGICISDMREHAAHTKWLEENNARRYNVKR
jgi:hypothetical protein